MKLPTARPVSHDVTPKANGQDVPLDPRIVQMVNVLDQVLRAHDPKVGVVVAAVGVLLGRKVLSPDHLERMVRDLTMATRVGFYLNRKDK